jgi:hypothetical protein
MRHMDCYPVKKIRVGRHLVGLVGLRKALEEAASAGLSGREEVAAAVLAAIAEANWIPDEQRGDYEEAAWREFLRLRGEDLGPLFVEQAVVVRGSPGEARDAFVRDLERALARFEMRPVVAYEPPEPNGPHPALVVDGEVVMRGNPGQREMWRIFWSRLSDW